MSTGHQKERKLAGEPSASWVHCDVFVLTHPNCTHSNPLADPLALIGILAILFPFIFVLIAIATGALSRPQSCPTLQTVSPIV